MGTWGVKLFDDDVALDVKDMYFDKLKRGLTNEEIYEIFKKEYLSEFEDDNAISWFALADCQWETGRLMPEVKECALYYIERGVDLLRWQEENPKEAVKRAKVLQDLKDKLNREQPLEKKIKVYKTTYCKWQIGDVYAYHLVGDFARKTKHFDKYLIMIKVGNSRDTPRYIIPMLYVLKQIFDAPPSLDEINNYPYLEQAYYPQSYESNKGSTKIYRLSLSSPRTIPKDRLSFLGNMGSTLRYVDKVTSIEGYDPLDIPSRIITEHINKSSYHLWRDLEEYILPMYDAWKANDESMSKK